MERVKQLNPDSRSGGSYTPLTSRRTSRDYSGGGGGNSWDKYSGRSGGSDYSNRSGYMSDYGGSNPSLYGSWDRTSTRSGRGYGAASRETSPVSSRTPARQYDYSSSASPSPYSTYLRGSETRSPSTQHRFERQNSLRSDMYEESPPRPRRKWEEEVYGVKARREALPEPVKPPPNDYSSDTDSAPEDEKGHARYLMSRGTSPMPEPGKREKRNKDASQISKIKRVKCPKEPRGRPRSDLRRRRLVDCATQTNLDEPAPKRRNRQGGAENRASRDEIAKMAALALLKDDSDNAGESFYKHREKFQQPITPLSPSYKTTTPGSSFEYDKPILRKKEPEERGWRKSVYDDSPPIKLRNESNRDSRYLDSVDVPDEKNWRKAVYGDSSPAPLGRLKHYQTEEDLRIAGESARARRMPPTSTPAHLNVPDEDSTESPPDQDLRSPSRRDRRSYNESEAEKRRSQQSENEKRRSQNESEGSKYRRSSSRDSILDDKPNRRRRQRTSSREILDESEQSQKSGRTALTPDSLSLRDSIEKVHNWKQTLPPSIQDQQHLAEKVSRHPESGFPKSDSGEYFSAHEQNSQLNQSFDPSSKAYKDTMYAQHSPSSPNYDDKHSAGEEDVLSPGGHRRRKNRRHLSRELSQESSVFDDERTHHPINKEKLRKSELNRSEELERQEKEELERRHRIYAGEDPEAVEESLRQRRGTSEAHHRDESPGRRRKRYGSRHNSREDILDDNRARKEKRDTDAHVSDSSQFGFNREGSPNRVPRSKRHSRHNSQEGVLDRDEMEYPHAQEMQYQHSQYMRPHSMVVSNESLANLSAASSIPSMHSALTDDGTIQNAASMQSITSNEVQEVPPDDQMASSGGSLPDIVPGDGGSREQISKNTKKPAQSQRIKSGLIGRTEDIDNLLNFSPNEEEFVEKGRGIKEVIKQQNSHILDAPVPREPSPMKPQGSGNIFIL